MSNHAWDCPCGTRNALQFEACRSCRRPKHAGRPATPVAASGRTGQFRPLSYDERLAEAARRLQPKPVSKDHVQWLLVSLGVGVVSLTVPALALGFFPAALAGGYFAHKIFDHRSRNQKPDSDTIAHVAAHIKGTMAGHCPRCNALVMTQPQRERYDWACPVCDGHLIYENGFVRAA